MRLDEVAEQGLSLLTAGGCLLISILAVAGAFLPALLAT